MSTLCASEHYPWHWAVVVTQYVLPMGFARPVLGPVILLGAGLGVAFCYTTAILAIAFEYHILLCVQVAVPTWTPLLLTQAFGRVHLQSLQHLGWQSLWEGSYLFILWPWCLGCCDISVLAARSAGLSTAVVFSQGCAKT